jgi:hypothetical protein
VELAMETISDALDAAIPQNAILKPLVGWEVLHGIGFYKILG